MLYRPTIIEGIPSSGRLSVILPVRLHDQRLGLLERLDFLRFAGERPGGVHFIVVDDGSDAAAGEQLRRSCTERSLGYIRLETEFLPFSIARARNAGACWSPADYVMFQDIDLVPTEGFYASALREIEVQGLDRDHQRFVMFGVIYLTQAGTREFFDTPSEQRREQFFQHMFEERTDLIEKTSTGTSAAIFNREYYLARGGNDEDFNQWGFDDIEFTNRCLRRLVHFPLPRDFELDYRNNRSIVEYKGWKAIYRLFGDMTFQKGVALFHAWHEVDNASDYMGGRKRNAALFQKKMTDFIKLGAEPDPLPSMCEGRTLLFSQTNPFIYNREVLPRLGEVVVEDEARFTPESLLAYIRGRAIDRVLMFNPYGSEERLALYTHLRAEGIPCIVAERGALPDSVFYDPNGFNAASCSYEPRFWDHPISDVARSAAVDYIRKERQGDAALEKQGARTGGVRLRRKLKIRPHQKVLFVPLQRPSDSVIRYFCGPIGSYASFIEMVADVTARLGSDWAVVVKRHPLEDETPEIPGAIFADDAHVKDLLELSDALLLINSGVGLLGLLWEKPVLVAGEAFYAQPGLAQSAYTAERVLSALSSLKAAERETLVRFVSYLVNDFYSFGTFTTREAEWEGGCRMTVTTGIDFYQIRGLGRTPYNRRRERRPLIPNSSVLFDRYRLDLQQPSAASAAKPAPSAGPGTLGAGRMGRKWKKFRQSPRRFCADSKFGLLRLLAPAMPA